MRTSFGTIRYDDEATCAVSIISPKEISNIFRCQEIVISAKKVEIRYECHSGEEEPRYIGLKIEGKTINIERWMPVVRIESRLSPTWRERLLGALGKKVVTKYRLELPAIQAVTSSVTVGISS